MLTTRARSAGSAPGGRDVGASDYLVLRAEYSISGKMGPPLLFPSTECRNVRRAASRWREGALPRRRFLRALRTVLVRQP